LFGSFLKKVLINALNTSIFTQKQSKYIITNNSIIKSKIRTIETLVWNKYVYNLSFIATYYTRSENLWQDGFLFDFLQKKTIDAWVRNFVIYTGFLFSERLVFDTVIKLYLDNLIWPAHNNSLFEISNVSEMLSYIVFLLVTIFFIVFTSYLFLNF
jgi:hypothetical protein